MSDKRNSQLQVASAFVSGHHGELVQGLFELDGQLERGLVTLPCNRYNTTATFYPAHINGIIVYPEGKIKAKKAAELVLERFGKPGLGGELVITSNAPVQIGVGSSTLDTIASIQATAKAINADLSSEQIIKTAVEAETASDPLIYENALLFAQRKGTIIEDYNKTLPVFAVLGFTTHAYGVDTVAMPLPQYSAEEIRAFRLIRDLIKSGIKKQDRQIIAHAATQSAMINQKYLPKKHLKEIIQIVRQSGGLGVQVSHSGSVVGCLFDPDNVNVTASLEDATRMISRLGYNNFYTFKTYFRDSN